MKKDLYRKFMDVVKKRIIDLEDSIGHMEKIPPYERRLLSYISMKMSRVDVAKENLALNKKLAAI